MPPPSPTVARAEFAARTRSRRNSRQLSAEDVRKVLGVSRVYLSAIENSRATLSLAKLPLLAEALGYQDAELQEMRALLEIAHQPGWWSDYRGVLSDEMLELIGLEYGSESISIYEARLVTGLLQTEAYAAEVVDAAPDISLADRRKFIEAKLRRQDRLFSDDPPRFQVIMGESALMQRYGTVQVLRDQLDHLVEMAERHASWLDLRIQPFDRTPLGLTAASTAALFTFTGPHMPTATWLEAVNPLGISYDPDVVADVELNFDQARSSSLDREDSLGLIRRRRLDLG